MASMARAGRPGQPLSRSNPTPFPVSRSIVGARWTSLRYDPPRNQWGDILPTVWSDDGVDVRDDGRRRRGRAGARAASCGASRWPGSTAAPPRLRFTHVGDPFSPPPHTWSQIGGNRTTRRRARWGRTTASASSRPAASSTPPSSATGTGQPTARSPGWPGSPTPATTARPGTSADKPFPAPLGNLTFIDGGGPRRPRIRTATCTRSGPSASSTHRGCCSAASRPGIAEHHRPGSVAVVRRLRAQGALAGARPRWTSAVARGRRRSSAGTGTSPTRR